MTNTNIRMNNGKTGELYQNIIAANENGASIEEIMELEKELKELKVFQQDYKYIPTMIDWLSEAKENAEQYASFEAVKAEIIASAGDEDIAEDMAWALIYGE